MDFFAKDIFQKKYVKFKHRDNKKVWRLII